MNKISILVAFTASLSLSGCIGQAYKNFSADWPSYQEVSQKSPIRGDTGRVFVYYPLKGTKDILEPGAAVTGGVVGVAATAGFGSVHVVVNKKIYAQVVDGSFGYVDLAPGQHQFLLASFSGEKYNLKVPVRRGQTTYVEFNHTSKSKTPPQIVSASHGRAHLSRLHNLGDNVDGIDSPQCYNGSFSRRAQCQVPKRLR